MCSKLIDNHKQSFQPVIGHHTGAINTSDRASSERSAGMRLDGWDMIGFAYEQVNYRNGCVNTYSLKGIWRHHEGSPDKGI